ncbi:hypothetical protein GBAR_LOCUS27759 [Geodia barretti]|uniref:CUB domain-containing protein n=2 Tax=Geodia barretti TaxID=519541 RepID=A0AA35XFK5_GEOBA|nr:hypothetical protein GBAR_LOCUS27759 [Geodia barretti]
MHCSNRIFRTPLLLVVVAGCCLCASYYSDTPADPGEPLAVTFNCEERWCNESWRGDRILRYNLSVAYEHLSESQSQHSGPILDCNGGQVSSNCVQEGSGTALTEELVKVVNRTLVGMEDLGPEGIIATDNFNRLLGELEGSYIANQDKIWQIKIPQNCQLWIVFEEFDVEPTPNCEKDYFSVQTSKNQPDIKKYCRTLESVTIQRRRRAQLWFHSDSSIQRRGIFARYCFRRISTNSSEQRQTMQLRCDCNLGGSHTRRRRQLQNQGMHVALQMLNCCLASRPSIVNP